MCSLPISRFFSSSRAHHLSPLSPVSFFLLPPFFFLSRLSWLASFSHSSLLPFPSSISFLSLLLSFFLFPALPSPSGDPFFSSRDSRFCFRLFSLLSFVRTLLPLFFPLLLSPFLFSSGSSPFPSLPLFSLIRSSSSRVSFSSFSRVFSSLSFFSTSPLLFFVELSAHAVLFSDSSLLLAPSPLYSLFGFFLVFFLVSRISSPSIDSVFPPFPLLSSFHLLLCSPLFPFRVSLSNLSASSAFFIPLYDSLPLLSISFFSYCFFLPFFDLVFTLLSGIFLTFPPLLSRFSPFSLFFLLFFLLFSFAVLSVSFLFVLPFPSTRFRVSFVSLLLLSWSLFSSLLSLSSSGYPCPTLLVFFFVYSSSPLPTLPILSFPSSPPLLLIFLEDYRVSLAERVIPAADLSEQIPCVGTEAAGTGNMKFMLNGSLLIGTRDGINVEIFQEVGEENAFIFGRTLEEVKTLRSKGYDPSKVIAKNTELRLCLEQLRTGYYNPADPDLFADLHRTLVNHDRFLVCADYEDYLRAQEAVDRSYRVGLCGVWSKCIISYIPNQEGFSGSHPMV
ncbi:unnamed protein product [Dicrocoelium dendriticum]|nr:unnamed protein product [Dicrocoelium dendriticum]